MQSGNSCLVKDSKGRVYNLGEGKINRYSADLQTKEEFTYSGGLDISNIRQIALIEDGNSISIVGFKGVSAINGGENFGLKTINISK